MPRTTICFIISFLAILPKAASQLSFVPGKDSLFISNIFLFLPQNFYKTQTGFFCKKEEQLQKLTGLNLFIRLGDKQYTDRMEGKNTRYERRGQ